ncbi:MAG: hypothetical protein JW959_01730 [Pirellulales bacterium]|nr:hypothetical protein [Pirellulales bacterium]
MAEALDTHGEAFKNGTVTLLARVVGGDADPITIADVDSIEYSIYLLDDQNPDDRTAVDGHADASLTVADVLFNSLQTDSLWTVDATGYNFRHTPEVAAYPAFAVAGRRYLVEYRIAPTLGQVIIVRFRINVT